ncbi:SAM-dependent methyltransferase [Desulfopila inferna]|uniref:SAM-dependent methyltransferase n=1 Tax=Desulfopila inferna TaxID=468528 RepID=UPI0019661941|nr:class I SAM-dependent methyltransferase [Desulfopila inferna]MBM9606562.1 class I SAM-dependent methyltransferase [Desulfopila inferna]
MSDIVKKLSGQNIHYYGSDDLLKFERQMERFFTREYERWRGNDELPEKYGVSSFEGDIGDKATLNVSVSHYDEEYQVYRAFLDTISMAYTTAYYGATNESPELDKISLEQAQLNKYKLVVERANVKNGQTVLDLGCGFGGLSKYLLKTFSDLDVVAINPSTVQVRHINNVLIDKDPDFDESRFTIIKKYFTAAEASIFEEEHFDRVISIGMLEHVTNIDLLLKTINRILKYDGKCLFHCIVSLDTIPNFLKAENSLIAYYYPGAHIWPYNEPQRHDTHLKFINSWFVNGMNYWKTLDIWHQRFWEAIEQLHPAYLSIDEVDKWNKYFSLCKTMFSPNNGRSYGNGQYLYEKE